jgi:crotonobetainyl-CoA:carnitine CoA-transferase CaiB-like acyl-CoA transferase
MTKVSPAIPADDLAVGVPADAFRMLEGITIVDLTTSIAGPYATMLLADFGARVIKIERPEGDDTRAWGPPYLDGEALWFLSVNRNKHSVRVDYSLPEGRRVLNALIDKADVLVSNQLGETQRKLGLDAESVRARRPQLIHVSITGFGLSGRNASLPCYDLIAEGYSGIMDLTGLPDSEPQKVGAPAADMLAGTDAALAVLAALHRRRQIGSGAKIDISLVESMVRFTSPRVVPHLGSGEVLRRSGGRDSVIAIYQTFDTADLPITLGLGNDRIWMRFWESVGEPQKALGPEMDTNAGRRAQRERIVADIQAILVSRKRHEWLELFRRAKVPAGPIYRVDEVVQDEHLRERGLFYRIERNGYSVPQVSLGIRIDDQHSGAFSAPPRLGEHTEDVLTRLLGYDSSGIAGLRAAGVI